MQSLVFYFIMFSLLLACTGNLVPRAVDFGKLQKIMPSTYRPFVVSLSVALVSSTIKCKISEDEYDFWFPMGVLYWTRIKHQLRLWTLLYTRTLRWHTHTKKGTGNKLNRNQFQYVVNIHAANPTLAYSGKTFTLSIQLFRERLSDKSLTVHATTPKGIMSCFSPRLLNRSISGKSEIMPLYRRGSVGLMNLFFLIWLLHSLISQRYKTNHIYILKKTATCWRFPLLFTFFNSYQLLLMFSSVLIGLYGSVSDTRSK